MTDIDATEILPIEPLRAFGEAVYQACGVPPADAALTVEIQLAADLRGVDTHGFQRLPWYAGHLREGRYNPTPSLAAIRETPVSLLVDGDGGIGQLVVARTMQRTIEKARETGLALGALRNSNDWGMGAYYPMMAAAEGFVSLLHHHLRAHARPVRRAHPHDRQQPHGLRRPARLRPADGARHGAHPRCARQGDARPRRGPRHPRRVGLPRSGGPAHHRSAHRARRHHPPRSARSAPTRAAALACS